jgi:hypothetical protein
VIDSWLELGKAAVYFVVAGHVLGIALFFVIIGVGAYAMVRINRRWDAKFEQRKAEFEKRHQEFVEGDDK